jgi:flagellar biosynthesis/type III secretory pathway chaperone
VVAGLAEKLGYAAPKLTLTGISQLVAEPHAGNLRRVSIEILSVLSQVQAANLRNKQIFEHSLELLKGSLNRLNDLVTPNTVYYRTGNIQSTKSTGKCVCSDI